MIVGWSFDLTNIKKGITKMKRRIKRILGLVICTSILFGSANVYATEKNVQYEANADVPERILEIANGSDNIYGEGVPIDHTENPNTRFTSGGIDHTHQYILAQALIVLNNDCGASIFNDTSYAEILMYNADWPDELGNETDYGTFSGHFYDPDTGKNWLGQNSPTARSRAESYYSQAVHDYNLGDYQSAMVYLGRGAHYVSDLNEPHHASNLTALNSNHTEFEKYVDENRTAYYIQENTLSAENYNSALNSSVGDLMYKAAKNAKSYADEAQDEAKYNTAARESVRGAIKTVVQYYYKFGKEVGIY